MSHGDDNTKVLPKLKLLKNQVRGHKTYINRLLNKITPKLEPDNTLNELTSSELEADIDYLDNRSRIMEDCFNLCLMHPEFQEQQVNEYSDYIMGVKRIIKRGYKKCKVEVSSSSAAVLNSTALDGSLLTKQLLTHAKLPTVDLPGFHGGENCWRQYRAFLEMFRSLIDCDPDLTDTLKVQYLRRALSGEALQLVSHLDPVAGNYALHLKTLKDAYQVGQEEVNNIIGKLNDINNWQKCQHSRDLFRLLTYVRQHYYLLNQVQTDTSGDIFIVRAIMGLLPDRLGYEIIKKVPVQERTVEKVLDYLQKDIDSCKEGESYGMGKGRSNKQTMSGGQGNRYRKAMNIQRKYTSCVYCGEGHSSHRCTSRSVEECWSILRKDWRCFNCLRDDHGAGECREPSQCDCGRDKPHSPSICRDRATSSGMTGRFSRVNVAAQNNRGGGRGRARGKWVSRGSYSDKGDLDHNTTSSVAEGGTHTLSAEAQVFQPSSPTPRGRGRGRGRRGAYFCQGAWGAKFMMTALVQVRDPESGNTLKGRLVLDTAAHDSYILESTANRLKCNPVGWDNLNVEVFGTDQTVKHRSRVVEVELFAKDGTIIPLEFFTINRVCGPIAGNKLSGEALKQVQGYSLADPETILEGDMEAQMLIGLDQFWDIVRHKIRLSGFGPRLVDTRVGWVLSGAITRSRKAQTRPSHCYLVSRPGALEIQVDESLEDILHRFWDLSTVGVKEEEVSPVTSHFESTVRFDTEQCRMEVKIPWRANLMPYLPDNRRKSLLQENLLQQRLALPKNAELQRKYAETIQKHLDEGVVEIVPKGESRTFCNNQIGSIDYNNSVLGTSDEQFRVVSYVPHHGVEKKDKVRIVFNASMEAYPGALSLNDCIHAGPSLLTDLVEVLMRFRTHSIALVGDITGAFHQVSLSETDRDAFRFLWHRDGQLEEYRFCRVPFGCTVSPFLLNSTVRAHLKEALKDEPELFELIVSALYVDDYLGGGGSVEAVLELQALLQKVLRTISMEWHGWMSNSEVVRRELEVEEVVEQSVLGLKWNPEEDVLSLNWHKVLSSLEDPKSKRDLLSGTASMWDPLGAYLPVLLALKLMFQSVCKSKCGWKGKLPSEMRESLEDWKSQLPCLQATVIPRYVLLHDYDELELHGFADASLQAYGAVVYIRCVRGAQVDCNFVMARNRVAPLKGQTLQRLELMGAVLLCRLTKKVLESHKALTVSKVVYYTDSRDVLCWIQSRNIRWSLFIENRVTEIHQSTNTTMWKHVSTELNPADTLTRPVAASTFVKNLAWFKGPEFLYTGEPSSKLNPVELEPGRGVQAEMRRMVKVAVRSPPIYLIDLDRFGSYFKLIDTTVLVLKFLFLNEREKWMEKLTYDYSNYARAATKYWVRLVQVAYYPQEVAHCPVGAYVPKVGLNSTDMMRSFRLFKDEDGLMRVSSRVQSEVIPWEARNPVLLPPDSKFTRLYVEMVHRVSLHVGYRQTLTNIRQQYFIPKGRRLVRSVIMKCVICLKAEGKFYPTLASPPLPDFRLSQVDPFTNCGVDFAGPVKVKEVGRKVGKGYIMLLTCASTRAVGLELLLGLTVQDMTLGFRRFCARMNTVPSLMVSDNAATFKRAAKELEEVFASPKMEKYLNGKRIKWQFYLQRCPWWGGFIEKMVQSVKKSLKKVVGEAYLSYVEFNTILLEIESLINARPITWNYEDPNEPGPIAPSDLLHGRPFRQFPPMYEVKVDGKLPQMCKGRLRYLEKLKTHWWDRWQNEYLKELQEVHTRRKVTNNEKAAVVGDVVLVRNQNIPRGAWKLGVISEVKPGKDGLIRTAKVELVKPGQNSKEVKNKKTGYARSELNRSPTHLVPLEINERS